MTCLFLLLFFNSNTSYAQTGKAKKEFAEYVQNLKNQGVKNFVSVLDGCWGCEVEQKDSNWSIYNAVNITLIYENEDVCKMAIFSDFSNYFEFKISDCSIFTFIETNFAILNQKEVYYTKLKAQNFFKPISPHHSYEQIYIVAENYSYTLYLIRDIKNGDAPELRRLDWYKLSEVILEKVDTIKKNAQN